MPQWRKLHTKITESLDVAEMPDDFTRLLWVLLPTQLCREGRGVDNPSWVRARVFPLREDVTLAMVSAAMDWYESRGMIVRYQVAGRGYFYLPNYADYLPNACRPQSQVARWRTAVFERDNYTCQKCGRRGVKLQAHHVIPWHLSSLNRFGVANGITLCRECHRAEHGKGWKHRAEARS